MSETTEEGRPGRRPSSSGPGRGRGRARGRGRGLLRIAQQQDVPGGKLTTTSSPEKSLPEITSQTQDQYQDSNDSNDCCEATASRGATLQDSPKPGTLQSLGQIEGTITVGDSIVYKSILPSFTTRDGNQAVVLTKLEGKQLLLGMVYSCIMCIDVYAPINVMPHYPSPGHHRGPSGDLTN